MQNKEIEKKCENCVFHIQKPDGMSFPVDFTCGSRRSKWRGYWPYNCAYCEYFTEPTGKTVAEVIEGNDQLKTVVDGFASMMGGFWGKNREELIADFMNQDAAVFEDYEIGEHYET